MLEVISILLSFGKYLIPMELDTDIEIPENLEYLITIYLISISSYDNSKL